MGKKEKCKNCKRKEDKRKIKCNMNNDKCKDDESFDEIAHSYAEEPANDMKNNNGILKDLRIKMSVMREIFQQRTTCSSSIMQNLEKHATFVDKYKILMKLIVIIMMLLM